MYWEGIRARLMKIKVDGKVLQPSYVYPYPLFKDLLDSGEKKVNEPELIPGAWDERFRNQELKRLRERAARERFVGEVKSYLDSVDRGALSFRNFLTLATEAVLHTEKEQ